ncbi:transcriptional initiation protein Tat [Chenggangzhangella methanolivorans]|uniref:thiosulfate dehydrogenase n=1 Tax=Chenggangzhangella methanolivorans TaxID=1437009 RepID=UPI00360D9F98
MSGRIMPEFHVTTSRRAALGFLGASAVIAGASPARAGDTIRSGSSSGEALRALKASLAAAPRRRSFKTVPFMVTRPDEWDHEAAQLVLSYGPRTIQMWESTDLGAPWLNLMREALNGQVFAHKNPDFLPVAAVHGSAHLTLFDQAAWDMYALSSLSGGKATANKFVSAKPGTTPSDDLQDLGGYYGPQNNNIQTLQERGAAFIACHDSIHAIARTLQTKRPTGPSADMIAADLTNHLVEGSILVPSVVAFLAELQRAGFTYAKAD